MKRTVLPLGALLFMIACGDDSTSANYQWAEDTSSSSKNVSSSSTENASSSSTEPALSSSEGSSSSSMYSISSSNFQNGESSSSVAASSSSKIVSSSSSVAASSSSIAPFSSSSWIASSEIASSSSEILTDPSKIFEIRKPQAGVLPCEIPWGGDEVQRDTLSQHDVICTYDYNGEKGFLYVQLTPNSCAGGMSITPGSYNVDKAEFYINGKFADVSNVDYEWGGNHHVERLQFVYKGNVFRYSQSTMGWGGRPCQNMDCLKVFESDGKTYIENGCNERSLPIVCRNVNGNGEIVSDFTDTYKVCEGDPRTLGYDVEY